MVFWEVLKASIKFSFLKNEQSWNGDKYNCKIGKKNKVVIKELSNRGDSLIGTFRPLIPHPLALFSNKFDVGQILKPLKVLNTYNWEQPLLLVLDIKSLKPSCLREILVIYVL